MCEPIIPATPSNCAIPPMQETQAAHADLDQLKNLLLGHLSRDGMDLTVRQLTILLVIFKEDGPHTVGSLARRLGVPKPAITRSVDRLEKEGLVRKVRDTADRRVVHVTRSMAGAKMLLAMQADVEKALQE